MRFKVIADGIRSNGVPVPIGAEITINDRVPPKWLKCLKEIKTKPTVPAAAPAKVSDEEAAKAKAALEASLKKVETK